MVINQVFDQLAIEVVIYNICCLNNCGRLLSQIYLTVIRVIVQLTTPHHFFKIWHICITQKSIGSNIEPCGVPGSKATNCEILLVPNFTLFDCLPKNKIQLRSKADSRYVTLKYSAAQLEKKEICNTDTAWIQINDGQKN